MSPFERTFWVRVCSRLTSSFFLFFFPYHVLCCCCVKRTRSRARKSILSSQRVLFPYTWAATVVWGDRGSPPTNEINHQFGRTSRLKKKKRGRACTMNELRRWVDVVSVLYMLPRWNFCGVSWLELGSRYRWQPRHSSSTAPLTTSTIRFSIRLSRPTLGCRMTQPTGSSTRQRESRFFYSIFFCSGSRSLHVNSLISGRWEVWLHHAVGRRIRKD